MRGEILGQNTEIYALTNIFQSGTELSVVQSLISYDVSRQRTNAVHTPKLLSKASCHFVVSQLTGRGVRFFYTFMGFTHFVGAVQTRPPG